MFALLSVRVAVSHGFQAFHWSTVRPARPRPPRPLVAVGEKPDSAMTWAATRAGLSAVQDLPASMIAARYSAGIGLPGAPPLAALTVRVTVNTALATTTRASAIAVPIVPHRPLPTLRLRSFTAAPLL